MSLQMLKKRTVKVLALLGVLALVGIAMGPMAVGDIAAVAATYNEEPEVGVGGVLIGALALKCLPELIELGLVTSAAGGFVVVGGAIAIAV